MNNTVNTIQHGGPFTSGSLLKRGKGGFMVAEIIMALIVLGFIIRPVMVDRCDEWGDRTTTVEWELPMVKLLDYVSSFQTIINNSWAGMDSNFGYTKGMPADVGKLMTSTAKHGVVLMTAGFVDQDGRFSGDFSNNIQRFQESSEGISVAFYEAAREGMSH